jgi:hypothetical protein
MNDCSAERRVEEQTITFELGFIGGDMAGKAVAREVMIVAQISKRMMSGDAQFRVVLTM